MRRWPMYIVFAVCILLTLSLFNSWGLETELRSRIAEISSQLQECSKQQSTCMEDSLTLLEQKDGYINKAKELEKQKKILSEDVKDYKDELTNAQKQFNRSLVDVELCKTELQSLKNLQLTKTAMLDTLRLEKETLTTQLIDKKDKIASLEREIEKLKASLTTKSVPNPSQPSKISPAAAPPKQSPSIQENRNVLQEAVLENNDAKEDLEENVIDNDFDPQLNN
ncbi:hypothetical protein NE865_07746 [Phthorimaea operculella]|nr:hypothetical protein NE865_07746 [Phthorimaea operculella]